MKFSERKAAIIAALSPELAECGFRYQATSARFIRKPTPGCTHAIHLLILESAPFVRLDVHLAVRLDAVEKIFHRTSGYEKKYQSSTPTVGGALDAITGNPQLRLLLEPDRERQQARALLLDAPMLDFYDTWFARFSELENIDHELNDDPLRDTPNRPMPWLRCSTGIIVAWMRQRPDYDRIADAYRGVLRAINNGFYLPRFELLLADLAALKRGPTETTP
jgi:hypothetical protein